MHKVFTNTRKDFTRKACTSTPQVIVLGDIILDMIAHIPRYPQSGGDGIARNVIIKSGGSAANTARALARCSIPTSLIGRIGNDVFARQALAELCGPHPARPGHEQ